MESQNINRFTVIVYENGDAEIKNEIKEENKREKITVENNLHAPLVIVVKKINEEGYKGYAIEIYDRTKYKDIDGSYLVTTIDKLVITDEN